MNLGSLFSRKRRIPQGVPTHSAETTKFSLDHILLDFGGGNVWTVNDATRHCAIFGMTGSGKTSGSCTATARAFLQSGFGGIVTTVKAGDDGDAQWWRNLGEATGRIDDMIFFNPDNPHRFNFMEFAQRLGQGGGIIENLAEMLVLVCKAGTKPDTGGTNEQFWEDCLSQLIKGVLSLLSLTLGEITLQMMLDVVRSVPTSLNLLSPPNDPDKPTAEEKQAIEFRDDSFCYHLICIGEQKLADKELGEYEYDWELTASYFMQTLPSLSDQTRSSIIISFESLADSLLRQPLRRLFEETSISPSMTLDGKIIILDLPMHSHGTAGSRAQAAFLYLFQRMCENRNLAENDRPVFWFSDEASFHVDSRFTPAFLSTCRSKRVMCVLACQDYSSYILKFGRHGKEAADKLLSNCSTRIYHAQVDSTTNQWAADSIGRIWQTKQSIGQNYEISGSRSTGAHTHEIESYAVMPHFFTTLKTGGAENDFQVEGLITIGGREFTNGKTYWVTKFPQIYPEDKKR